MVPTSSSLNCARALERLDAALDPVNAVGVPLGNAVGVAVLTDDVEVALCGELLPLYGVKVTRQALAPLRARALNRKLKLSSDPTKLQAPIMATMRPVLCPSC